MNKQELDALYRSLARDRDGFMIARQGRSVRRLSRRDREILECFRNRRNWDCFG